MDNNILNQKNKRRILEYKIFIFKMNSSFFYLSNYIKEIIYNIFIKYVLTNIHCFYWFKQNFKIDIMIYKGNSLNKIIFSLFFQSYTNFHIFIFKIHSINFFFILLKILFNF